MDKRLDMKSVMAVAFLYLAVSYFFLLLHRITAFIIQSTTRSGYFILSNLFNILVVLIILFIMYKKIASSDFSAMRKILENSTIRVTAGFLIMITTVIGLFNWIPSFTIQIHNHLTNMPDSSLPYYQQYILSFRENITSNIFGFILTILEFFVGFYLIYKYKNKQPSTPEAQEKVI